MGTALQVTGWRQDARSRAGPCLRAPPHRVQCPLFHHFGAPDGTLMTAAPITVCPQDWTGSSRLPSSGTRGTKGTHSRGGEKSDGPTSIARVRQETTRDTSFPSSAEGTHPPGRQSQRAGGIRATEGRRRFDVLVGSERPSQEKHQAGFLGSLIPLTASDSPRGRRPGFVPMAVRAREYFHGLILGWVTL